MARFHRALRLTPLLLLAACASVPMPSPKTAAGTHRITLPPPATFDPGQAQARIDGAWSIQAHADPGQVWEQLRESFTMDGCQADPSIMHWARRYTRNRSGFENRLRAALPKIAYIQQTADKYGIPGEFALLPWVESRYRAVPSNGSGSTGAWQITARTATTMGLRVDERYDGRLDLQASSTAVMQLLRRYHQRFDDWRMVTYAYNAGESATARFVKRQGPRTAQAAIPAWPGHSVTQRHLSQLLAIACVVRNPERFGVTLPGLREARRLTAIPVEGTLALDTAARYAGLPVETLKQFNAGFLDGVIDGSTGADLLLPAAHARQFRAASANVAPEAAIADSPRPARGN
jgi:membrane-bound lytic murein transglycosylase D